MRYCKCLFLLFLFSSLTVFSQESFKQHVVLKGETINQIAQRYNIKTESIYQLNPDAVNGIKSKMVLLIPAQTKKSNTHSSASISTNNTEQEHRVLPKETLYGITKQYKISLDELYKTNPNLEKEGLKIGQIVKIPLSASTVLASATKPQTSSDSQTSNVSKKNDSKTEVATLLKVIATNNTEKVTYEVLPKQSLYSIAKQYGISVADLQKANPELENKMLNVGQKIIIPVKEISNSTVNNTAISTDKKVVETQESKPIPVSLPTVAEKKPVTEKPVLIVPQTVVKNKNVSTEITHEVLPKESLYSIAKQNEITLADLQKANPELGKRAIRIGQKIVVPVKGNSIVPNEKSNQNLTIPVLEDKKSETQLTHEVLPKETKYGIAKEYGLTVAELEKQNPNITRRLRVGSMLNITTSKLMALKAPVEGLVVVKEDVDKKDSFSNTKPYDPEFVDKLISTASENMGTRYRSGGTTKDGFDCSGFMCYTFGTYDIKLPRSSIDMASYGEKVDAESAQKGDLIFFKTGGRRRINHVGMVVEVSDGEIKFIHSSTSSGIMISSTKESYYEKNFAQVNRVLQK